MTKFSYKYKIYIVVAVWVVVSAVLFGYVFDLINNGSQATVDEIVTKKKELLELQAEQRSYQLGKTDLQQLEKKELQPDNFFSSDTSLVREISTLENLAVSNNLKITIGIGGTSNALLKAKTASELLLAPYNMSLSGSYSDILNFMQSVEKLGFITHFKTLLVANSGQTVTASASAIFYIKK